MANRQFKNTSREIGNQGLELRPKSRTKLFYAQFSSCSKIG